MPLRARVDGLVNAMKEGRILEGFDEYYAESVSMRENRGEPTLGKKANRAREEAFLGSVKAWKGLNVRAVAVDEASRTAFVEYDFDFISTDDAHVKYEQVSVQRWDGAPGAEQIVDERFYYDSAP